MAARDDEMIAEIDLRENCAYVVRDGQLTKLSPMSHGVDEVSWKDGKVLDVIRSHRIRLGNVSIISENQ